MVVNERGLGRLMVYFGDGSGGIASSIQLPMDNPAGSVLGDTNNDGFLDVVSPSAIERGGINLSLPGTVGQSSTDSVFVFRGDGAGNFEAPNSYDSGIIFEDSQGRPAPLVLHEISGDSIVDLITAGENANQISLMLGDGSGGLQTPQILSIPSTPSAGVEALAVVNANADSIPDIVALLRGGQISVFHGTGNGAFGPGQPSPTADAEAMIVADVDRDGNPDVLLARNANSSLVIGDFVVLFGNAQGLFDTELFTSTAPGFSPQSLVLADFNEDGDLDVAAETREGKVLLGNGDGTFGPPIFLDDPDSQRSAIAAGDLNGDGNLDIVMTSGFSQTGSPGKVTIFAGDGAGGFQELFEFPVGTGPRSVTLALLNNDGILDLATANAFSDDVSVLIGNGDGPFQTAQSFSAGNTAVSVAAADFNEDNMVDLVAANEFSDNVSVLIGDGQGGFTALPFLSVGGRPREVVAVDLNLDNHVDIATANVESKDLTVLFGDGTGSFSPPLTLSSSASLQSLAAADLDDDGFPDLVSASSSADDVAVFYSDGLRGFRPEQRFTITGNTTSAVAGDVNGDNKPDLVVGAGRVVAGLCHTAETKR